MCLQRIAGEIKSFSTDGWVAPKLSKRMDKFMLYMLTAGKKALVDGGITDDVMDELNKDKCGVLIVDTLLFFTVAALNLKDVSGYSCVTICFPCT